MSDARPISSPQLTAEDIIGALRDLSDRLAAKEITGEICLFGGAVMVLVFHARPSTKDVDAIFQPASEIRAFVKDIGAQRGLALDWLNDGVKGFIAAQPEVTSDNLPQFPNLRLVMPVPEYLLAMKCIAARIGEISDVPDIIHLIRHLGFKKATEVLDVVSRYYGKTGVPIKTQYLVEGLFDEGQI